MVKFKRCSTAVEQIGPSAWDGCVGDIYGYFGGGDGWCHDRWLAVRRKRAMVRISSPKQCRHPDNPKDQEARDQETKRPGAKVV
jgi:hypothetical protein